MADTFDINRVLLSGKIFRSVYDDVKKFVTIQMDSYITKEPPKATRVIVIYPLADAYDLWIDGKFAFDNEITVDGYIGSYMLPDGKFRNNVVANRVIFNTVLDVVEKKLSKLKVK
jgi:hypothetical protein